MLKIQGQRIREEKGEMRTKEALGKREETVEEKVKNGRIRERYLKREKGRFGVRLKGMLASLSLVVCK